MSGDAVDDMVQAPDERQGPVAQLLNIHDGDLGDGRCVVRMTVTADHLNLGGWTHGGVVSALLDFTLGGAVVSILDDGEWCATQSLTTDFLRPSGEGDVLVCEARVERRGKLVAYPAGEVRREGDGKVVARATGVWAIRATSSARREHD